MKAENYYLKFTFYQMRQIVFLYILLRHKFEKSLEISLFSVFFVRINFRKFVSTKYFAGINYVF